MSSSLVVAVTAAVNRDDGAASFLRLRSTYLIALENARLIPFVSAAGGGEQEADALLARADGLVLTGGEDVNPARYGAEPHPKLGTVSDDRDSWELALVHAAARRHLPTLAICRGVQLLNVALGGTLVQDLPSCNPGGQVDHDPGPPRNRRTHALEIKSGSRVGRATGVPRMEVNSIHHQAIDRLADSLHVTATAPDGTIEAVESAPDSGWWCVGVQWHPEELVRTPEDWDRAIFTAFADAVWSRQQATPTRR